MKHHKIKSIFILCLVLIISNIILFEKPVYSESNNKKKILIINSYSKENNFSGYNTNNWHDEIIDGLELKLKDYKDIVDVNIEYIDSNLSASDEYYESLYDLYNYKYKNTEFDTIITLNNNDTDFILKLGNDLFPDTPVLFSNVNQIEKILLDNETLSSYSISKQTMIYILFIFILILIVTIIFLQTTIRKLKNTKKLLLNSEKLLKTIMNSTPDIICYKNPDGQMLQANNAILDLLNIKENEHKYKTFTQLYDLSAMQKDELITCEYHDNKCWEYGDVYRTEEILTSAKDNIRKTYDIIKIPLFNKDKTRKGLITIGRDITEHKANEKNKKIIAELKYSDKLKMEFFTNLSHELRTPLNVIFSALQVIDETLKNNIESNKINKYTNIMKQNCYRLTRLMNNFLDISKIDSENFSLELQNIDIISEVENIVLSIADYVESKGLSIIFDTEVEEKIIACDSNAIERIMLNLLSNSVKFTPFGGSIKVNISYRYNTILISVRDTGIGIPPKKQKAIFDRFVQVDKSLSRNREGSGIGLSLVKSLVELHKGTITLVSIPNEGSNFILKFPVQALPGANNSVSDYNFNKNKDDIIKLEFSDIYS